jgi:hypothetical protein
MWAEPGEKEKLATEGNLEPEFDVMMMVTREFVFFPHSCFALS